MHLHNARYIVFAEIGHRDIIPHQKGQTGIIIFEIQRFSHPRRHLVNETKYTFVHTVLFVVHQKGVKVKTDIVIFSFFECDLKDIAPAAQLQCHPRFGQVKSIIQHITNFVPIDADQKISGANPRFLRCGCALHR